MLSQLLFVRLKAAENALRDGRLDEAHRLATAPDIRGHRRGRAVLAGLAEKLVERARSHFRADRFTEALMDLDKAEAGGTLNDQIAELRRHIQTVMTEQRRHEQSRIHHLQAARRRIDDGSLAAGHRLLGQAAEDDPEAGNLRREIERRAEEAQRIAEQADQLIAEGRYGSAADRLRKAKTIDAHNRRAAAVESLLCKQVFDSVRAAIVEGKLKRAADELSAVRTLGTELPVRRELDSVLVLVRQTGETLQSNDFGAARRNALSLKRLVPDARWLDAAVEQMRQLEEIRTSLYAGPLGDGMMLDRASRGVGHGPRPERGPAEKRGGADLNETLALPGRSAMPGTLPERLLLLIDGGGSYLILCGGRATIGRVASGHPADVALYSDVAERHANIQLVDDDYFLFATKEVEVGGHRTQHCLLKDGDRIVLGRKAKMTFRLPSRKSPTAVLDLSDTTKMPNDVRRVVLFESQATLGEGARAHIRCRPAGPPLVLFDRAGELWIRQRSDGHVNNEAVRLTLGEQVEIAGASLVVQRWDVQSPGIRSV